ncbi:hypothetical protein EI94DRAFT_179345 [Lactarius quietus]|nr:hypothetical protein EI94DRAFT_179345 [Lactarius quietus]
MMLDRALHAIFLRFHTLTRFSQSWLLIRLLRSAARPPCSSPRPRLLFSRLFGLYSRTAPLPHSILGCYMLWTLHAFLISTCIPCFLLLSSPILPRSSPPVSSLGSPPSPNSCTHFITCKNDRVTYLTCDCKEYERGRKPQHGKYLRSHNWNTVESDPHGVAFTSINETEC